MRTMRMNTEQNAILDDWANMVVTQLKRPKRKTPHLELAERIHQHEESCYIKDCTHEVWDEPTSLI